MPRLLLLALLIALCSVPSYGFASPKSSSPTRVFLKQQTSFVLFAGESDSEETEDAVTINAVEESAAPVPAKAEDAFASIRLPIALVLASGGLANMVNDASKLGAAFEGGYGAGIGINVGIDALFTLAMVGAVFKEWERSQES